jgi:molecular chaperone GrpE
VTTKAKKIPDNGNAHPQEGQPDIESLPAGEASAIAAETNDAQQSPGGEEGIPAELPAERMPTELEKLQDELTRAQTEAAQNLEGWQRALAEFSNYRKRLAREQEESYQRIASDIICRFLGVLDDLERALKKAPTEGEAAQWAEGIELIYQKLKNILDAEGVELIPIQPGQRFDPTWHEAVSLEESEAHQEGQIIDVLEQGYHIGERVLRPAKVRVAK